MFAASFRNGPISAPGIAESGRKCGIYLRRHSPFADSITFAHQAHDGDADMRAFAITLAVAAIAASSPMQAQARSTQLITLRTGSAYASCQSTPGLANACGGHSAFSGCGHRRYRAATQTYMITPVGTNCPPVRSGYGGGPCQKSHPRALRSLGMRFRHEMSHCVSYCFPTGDYCSCCDHSLKPIPDHSFSHLMHAALVRCGVIDVYHYDPSYIPYCGPGPSR